MHNQAIPHRQRGRKEKQMKREILVQHMYLLCGCIFLSLKKYIQMDNLNWNSNIWRNRSKIKEKKDCFLHYKTSTQVFFWLCSEYFFCTSGGHNICLTGGFLSPCDLSSHESHHEVKEETSRWVLWLGRSHHHSDT